MSRISDRKYNNARASLIQSGSESALAAHPKHTSSGDSPMDHARSLVKEAIEEFQASDEGGKVLTRGMVTEHFVAVSNAAYSLGLDIEDFFNTEFEVVDVNYYRQAQ